MKAIPMPVSREEKIEVIQRYFYGSHPHYQALSGEDEGKSYPAYHSLRKYPKGVEPDLREIIAEHVDGVRVWASRATSSAGAHFAAIDVDTTDPGVLRELRERLDALYGPRTYNWEQREGSGVHVWLLWDGVIERELGETLVGPVKLDEWLSDVVDVIYPLKLGTLRLPFPGAYDPMSEFVSDVLTILEPEDVERRLLLLSDDVRAETRPGITGCSSGVEANLSDVPDNTKKHSSTYCLGHLLNYQYSESTGELLKEKVDRALSTAPEDGRLYEQLIMNNLLSNCLGVYGESVGMMKLQAWIHSGNEKKIEERLNDLGKYSTYNESAGHLPALDRPPLDAGDIDYFKSGMFDDLLSFIRRSDTRLGVSRCLFAMLVCEFRARQSNVNPWWIGIRDLAKRLGHQDETGRRRLSRHLNFILVDRRDDGIPIFSIVEEATHSRARRFALEPDYEFLLDRLPELPPLHREQ